MDSNILKNYNYIIECEFLEDDLFSKKLVEYYVSYIKKIDFSNQCQVEKLIALDNSLYKYIEDYNFSKKLKETIDVSEVISENFSYLNELFEYIINFAFQYDKQKVTSITQTEWL